jgi:spore coat polysaccharide biosynthesis protein SpsF
MPKNQKIVTIVQARMGSTRLPGKHMKTVLGKPLLGYLIERLRRVSLSHALVIATTDNPLDDILVEYCRSENCDYFRGSEEDVLDRFYQCSQKYQADAIVRVCADCPLIDPYIIDQVISCYLQLYPKIDYVANTLRRTYPRGMDVEIFSFHSFQKVTLAAKTQPEHEHVTPYYYLHPDLFILENVADKEDNSRYRLTVDTDDDFKLIRLILEDLYPKNSLFCLNDIVVLMKHHSDWVKINENVHQKSI